MSTLQDHNSTIARPRVRHSALTSAPVRVTIKAVRPGKWLVRSHDDRFGGMFVCPKAALKFVRDEVAADLRAVMIEVDGILAMGKKSADRTVVAAAGQGFKPAA